MTIEDLGSLYSMLKDSTIENRLIWWELYSYRSDDISQYLANQLNKNILFEIVRLSKEIDTNG